MSETSSVDELTLEVPFHPALRVIFLLTGVFCVCVATWELRYAFLRPGWWTLFFGIILYGAWSVGGSMAIAAIKGESQTWRFRDGALVVEGTAAFSRSVVTFRAADIDAIDVHESDSDGGANTFSVVLRLTNGRMLSTAQHGTKQSAQATEAAIRAALRMA